MAGGVIAVRGLTGQSKIIDNKPLISIIIIKILIFVVLQLLLILKMGGQKSWIPSQDFSVFFVNGCFPLFLLMNADSV